MRKALRPFLVAAMVMVVITVLSGCVSGPPNLTLSFFPEAVRLEPGDPIDVTLIMAVKGFGVLRISGMLFEFFDADGNPVHHEELPDRKDFPKTYSLPVVVEVAASVPLADVIGEAFTAEEEWWLPTVPHPATVRITFIDPSGKPVGGGQLGLTWAELVPSI